jgi:hypothetical protein
MNRRQLLAALATVFLPWRKAQAAPVVFDFKYYSVGMEYSCLDDLRVFEALEQEMAIAAKHVMDIMEQDLLCHSAPSR